MLATFIIFAVEIKKTMAKKIDEIGSMFLSRRKELNLTQEELGERIGVSKSEISKIENGRGITFATINKMSEALGVSAEVTLAPAQNISLDVIHYITMCIGLFARTYNLTKREACRYLSMFRGLHFAIENYEAEHQLSLQECVDDMVAVCQRNGGRIG